MTANTNKLTNMGKKACRHGSCGKFDKPKAGVRGGRDRPRKLRIYGAREEAGGRGRLER